jgi:hypothetical protein
MRIILALLVAMPLAAAAQESAPHHMPPAPPQQYQPGPQQAGYGARRHDGFFIRPELGVGYVSTKGTQDGVTLKVSGSGATLGLAIGGAVTENFILAAQVWDIVASSPDAEVSGGGLSASGSVDGTSAVVGYGVLLNWYLQNNVYLAVTPSLTRLVLEDGSSTGTSEWGVGLRGAVGKEWWVSNNWGLGLAASLAFSSNKDSSASNAPTLRTTGFGLTFSATYN